MPVQGLQLEKFFLDKSITSWWIMKYCATCDLNSHRQCRRPTHWSQHEGRFIIFVLKIIFSHEKEHYLHSVMIVIKTIIFASIFSNSL